MQCEDILIELDAYMTGELDYDKSTEIERHIQECVNCRTEFETIRKERLLYQEYVSQVGLPSRSLLETQIAMIQPKVQPQISESHKPLSPIHWRLWPAAAAILLFLGVSWYFFAHQKMPKTADRVMHTALSDASPAVQKAMTDFEQAIAGLQSSYADKRGTLDPGLVRELDGNLSITQSAITECKQALKENPNNDQAITFLMLDYQKHLGILRHITEEL